MRKIYNFFYGKTKTEFCAKITSCIMKRYDSSSGRATVNSRP